GEEVQVQGPEAALRGGQLLLQMGQAGLANAQAMLPVEGGQRLLGLEEGGLRLLDLIQSALEAPGELSLEIGEHRCLKDLLPRRREAMGFVRGLGPHRYRQEAGVPIEAGREPTAQAGGRRLRCQLGWTRPTRT